MSIKVKEIGDDMAVIVMGPPGAGKTTQSERLAKRFGLVHVITSELIKSALYDPKNQDNPLIIREKKIFESGGINTPEWVTKMTLAKTKEVAQSRRGIIFSASPRTVYEAQGMMPVLKKLYPRNIFVFFLSLSFEDAAARIRERKLCSDCGLPVLSREGRQSCPGCGGDIISRPLDSEDKLKVRFSQYDKRTEPVMHFLSEQKLNIKYIDGKLPLGVVSAEILSRIRLLRPN